MNLTIHDELLGPDSAKYKLVSLSWLLGMLSAKDTLLSLATNPKATVVEIESRKAPVEVISVDFNANLIGVALPAVASPTMFDRPTMMTT